MTQVLEAGIKTISGAGTSVLSLPPEVLLSIYFYLDDNTSRVMFALSCKSFANAFMVSQSRISSSLKTHELNIYDKIVLGRREASYSVVLAKLCHVFFPLAYCLKCNLFQPTRANFWFRLLPEFQTAIKEVRKSYSRGMWALAEESGYCEKVNVWSQTQQPLKRESYEGSNHNWYISTCPLHIFDDIFGEWDWKGNRLRLNK